MNKKLQLAVNHALAVNNMAQQRINYLQHTRLTTGNTKRTRIYQEFGYPEQVNFDHFYQLYDRNSIASAAITRMIEGCWEDYPEIFEGDQSQDAKGMTNWDRKVNKLLKKWFPAIKEEDKRNLIGNYSAILIQFRDSERWDQPVNQTVTRKSQELAIVRLIPV